MSGITKYLSLLSFLIVPYILPAQQTLQIEDTPWSDALVKDVFIKGNCKNVKSIQTIGDVDVSFGKFSSGLNTIGIHDGIILSTGDIQLAPGPNIHNESTHAFGAKSDDPDLSKLASGDLYDVTGLEFDFIPFDDRVSFRYVFASEEYCEFVNTSFNDVFGFFVSGPGINGTFDNNAINVAEITTLTGASESVSINSINHLSNETFYVSNILTTDAQNCNIEYVPTFQEYVEYDGFTIPITAIFSVIPCETYHIRLVIGDVGDPNLDSAVFLQSNSFDIGEKVTISAVVPEREEPTAYEGCVDGQFVFTRNDLTLIHENCEVNFNIQAQSTATNSVDIEEIPLSITIPSGDTSYILPINVTNDNLQEGIETIQVEQSYQCDCLETAGTTIYIDDYISPTVSVEVANVCADQAFVLKPLIVGGVEPYSTLWSTGATTDSLLVSISESTGYRVSITDFCNNTIASSIDALIQDIPTAFVEGTYDLCDHENVGIPVLLDGYPPWTLSYGIDDIVIDTIINIQTNPYLLNLSSEGTYTLDAFSDAHCTGIALGSAIVEYSTFDVELEVTQPTCASSQDGSIVMNKIEALEPYTIEWSNGLKDVYILESLDAGNYSVSITDTNGCIYQKQIDLHASSEDIQDCYQLFIPNIFSKDETENNTLRIQIGETSIIEEIVDFRIYDRWGNLMYSEANFLPNTQNGIWNGEYKGNFVESGVYLYTVLIKLEGGGEDILSGNATFVK